MIKNLLLYHQSPISGASTINEHFKSFNKFSKGSFLEFNTFYQPSSKLLRQKFDVIIFHYSIFGSHPFYLSDQLIEFCCHQDAVKIYFFQDEHQNHDKRIEIIKNIGCSQIYTLAEEEFHDQLYTNYLKGVDVFQTLTGFVGDYSNYRTYIKEFSHRTIDIFYRARNLPLHLGMGSQEKHEIGEYFLASRKFENLNLNISSDESDRLYGKQWFKYLGNSKFTLGVEAGVSIFDVTGNIYNSYLESIKDGFLSSDEAYLLHLKKYEGNIQYRTISPRVFEAAAMKVCPIMFPGKYNNILVPHENYICIEKDFSNLEEVIACMGNEGLTKDIIQNNLDLLIYSEEYTLKNFIKIFDENTSNIISDFSKSVVSNSFFQVKYKPVSIFKFFYIKIINSKNPMILSLKRLLKNFRNNKKN